MAVPPPISMQWQGDAFTPASNYWAKKCDEHFVVGEFYTLEIRQDRSARSHAHYFASVNEAFNNLPDELSARFPTAEHLRKWALIRAGYRDQKPIVCANANEASIVASYIRPLDDYAAVSVRDDIVIVLTAKSQSYRAMGAKEFQKSKTAVLEILAKLIGTTTQALITAGETAQS